MAVAPLLEPEVLPLLEPEVEPELEPLVELEVAPLLEPDVVPESRTDPELLLPLEVLPPLLEPLPLLDEDVPPSSASASASIETPLTGPPLGGTTPSVPP
jgi:hypothetical protein